MISLMASVLESSHTEHSGLVMGYPHHRTGGAGMVLSVRPRKVFDMNFLSHLSSTLDVTAYTPGCTRIHRYHALVPLANQAMILVVPSMDGRSSTHCVLRVLHLSSLFKLYSGTPMSNITNVFAQIQVSFSNQRVPRYTSLAPLANQVSAAHGWLSFKAPCTPLIIAVQTSHLLHSCPISKRLRSDPGLLLESTFTTVSCILLYSEIPGSSYWCYHNCPPTKGTPPHATSTPYLCQLRRRTNFAASPKICNMQDVHDQHGLPAHLHAPVRLAQEPSD